MSETLWLFKLYYISIDLSVPRFFTVLGNSITYKKRKDISIFYFEVLDFWWINYEPPPELNI